MCEFRKNLSLKGFHVAEGGRLSIDGLYSRRSLRSVDLSRGCIEKDAFLILCNPDSERQTNMPIRYDLEHLQILGSAYIEVPISALLSLRHLKVGLQAHVQLVPCRTEGDPEHGEMATWYVDPSAVIEVHRGLSSKRGWHLSQQATDAGASVTNFGPGERPPKGWIRHAATDWENDLLQ